ncbi:MAG: hypothetical protein JKY96_04605 [Phycisphaerales bacterium]|nr:hypothetical protein [Phycisphaerales bacterium]
MGIETIKYNGLGEDNGALIIAQTEPMACSACGKEKELRPYGKEGAWVCFTCTMEDEDEGGN